MEELSTKGTYIGHNYSGETNLALQQGQNLPFKHCSFNKIRILEGEEK